MHFTSLQVAFSAFLATMASAETFRVEVGQSGLRFTPDTIKANEGDIIEFHFNGMHSVIAGDFANPCTPVSSGGFYSGVMPMGSQSVFSITITNTDPVFFYCGVDSHCQGGMSGVINQGSNTLTNYKSAAENVGNSVSPAAPFGGTLGSGGSSSVSSATESATTVTSQASTTESATAVTSQASTTESGTTATSQTSVTEIATTASSNASATEITTTAASASASKSPSAASASASKSLSALPTTVVAAAGHLTGPIARITCLVLVLGCLLAL